MPGGILYCGRVTPSRPGRPGHDNAGGRAHSHGHGHSHDLSAIAASFSPLARWVVIGALSLIGLGVAAGAMVLWPSYSDHPIPTQFRSADGGSITTVDAEIFEQRRANCLNPLSGTVQDTADIAVENEGVGPCIQNIVKLTSGQHKGRFTLLEVPTNRAQSGQGPDSVAIDERTLDDPQPGQPTLHVGDKIRVAVTPTPDGGVRYGFFDFRRGTATILWAIAFVAAIVLVASWRGLRSIIGLVFAFAVLGFFTLPAILEGSSPVAVAVVSSAVILFVVLYLAHGVSMRTSSALLGTLVSLFLAGALSALAITTMNLTGLSGDQTMNLQVYQGSISISGLLLAGFIIGALGVLNDVTITQASAAFELAAAGEPSRLATFRAAMRVGRDHIASTVYTLIFAYAGSALPLLLLFSVAQQPFGSLVTTDAVAVELGRSFVGGIAIALSVPLTTAIAAALTTPGADDHDGHHHDGHHHDDDHHDPESERRGPDQADESTAGTKTPAAPPSHTPAPAAPAANVPRAASPGIRPAAPGDRPRSATPGRPNTSPVAGTPGNRPARPPAQATPPPATPPQRPAQQLPPLRQTPPPRQSSPEPPPGGRPAAEQPPAPQPHAPQPPAPQPPAPRRPGRHSRPD